MHHYTGAKHFRKLSDVIREAAEVPGLPGANPASAPLPNSTAGDAHAAAAADAAAEEPKRQGLYHTHSCYQNAAR